MKLNKLPHDDDNEVATTFCLYYKLHNHTCSLFILCSTAVEMMVFLIHQVAVNTEMLYLCQVARVHFPATFLLLHSRSSLLLGTGGNIKQFQPGCGPAHSWILTCNHPKKPCVIVYRLHLQCAAGNVAKQFLLFMYLVRCFLIPLVS